MIYPTSSFFRLKRGAMFGLLALTCTIAGAAERVLRIEAPSMVLPKSELVLYVTARSDGSDSERVAFLQVEVSVDGGRSWVALCYLTNGGREEKQRLGVAVGSEGSQVRVRARAAFRRENGGDVDFRGEAIKWDETWNAWAEPPARHATITVKNR